ncbi:hypothetical protein LC613_01075 [Nostoc sphaeroides CHAB 2801]|uniref:hypothetical protein n=1 Tax=Nostoc sphaeroides TaxID=446679 RepID=UPI000E547174|nr:hypothetical protein [Nostoc sphaeroides]MCC5626856.1 hypothetical protein [Nostoc sphaeroides CHAB 2801]
MNFSANKYSRVYIKIRSPSFKNSSYSPLSFHLKLGFIFKFNSAPNRTLKQTIFGDSYVETATQIVIKKSELRRLTQQNNNTAESMLTSLFINTSIASPQAINIKFLFGGSRLTSAKAVYTYWFQVMDQPIDLFGRIDTSSPILIEGL